MLESLQLENLKADVFKFRTVSNWMRLILKENGVIIN